MNPNSETARFAKRIHVNQGEHEASGDPGVCLTAILGSCVAICLHDRAAKVGGMNHFLLPESPDAIHDAHGRYGAYLAELLINDLMRLGAVKSRLEAKVFGGGKMFQGLRDVGATNAAFAQRFLEAEGIPILGGSTEGTNARRVEFWPATGRAFQKFVSQIDPMPAPPPVRETSVGDVELF
ncbi:chemoreceptor glutamine deamidase CheD [Candidatus Phycosocius bacilliformis]|uniref:Probable chemoreceptor glutamine deamidase CheD n=1 Tax=Candidatus Phycosocius bacilliformis TaxID=1445552 RepID=A0A2P2E5Q5_9PROT|nr:chemotaxis protein CheD [Candidatus Phycosocius bacilliformis]GBF56395.1 chemoreceptor glutamine deamidase CheD [Candidatus Phycosocius bacilliformis]